MSKAVPPKTGLIPARAGNTLEQKRVPATRGAHPRSRGEHDRLRHGCRRHGGSSPLARGTLSDDARFTAPVGLIPARAGNTRERLLSLWLSRAHPRSRGEHSVVCKSPWTSKGSSPLARGTRCRTTASALHLGLIPARAGNTVGSSKERVEVRAHPRSRGEHLVEAHNTALESGSSPLARGTLTPWEKKTAVMGLIPARAGNTWGPCSIFSNLGAHPRSRGEHGGSIGGYVRC